MTRFLTWIASWADTFRAAEYGPHIINPLMVERAEASYQASKLRYEDCRARGDKRGEGEAWRAMNRALNGALAHSDASRLHTHRARFSVRSRPARA